MEISRRTFLAGAAVAAAEVAWPSLGDPLILGTGSHRYSCHHDWLTAPTGHAFGDTHGVAQDKAGRIYIAHTVHPDSASKNAVCVYSADGKFVESWGSEFAGGAHGLDLRSENGTEYLYHCDTNRRVVVKTDLKGKVIWERGAPAESGKYPNGEGYVPTNVAFGPNGDVYVADGYGSSYIHIYSKDGDYKKTFAGAGTEPGKTRSPHGIWLDDRGKEPQIVVADRSNRRLQYFDLDGKHVQFVTKGMRLPCHFSIQNGDMLIPDLESIVTIVDEKNQVVAALGDGAPSGLRGHPRNEFRDGKFIHPHSAKFLHNGDILVVEWVPIGRVTLLKKLK